MSKLPLPTEGIVLTHFIVSDDVERSRRFYTEVLGGETSAPASPHSSPLRTAGSSSMSAVDQPTTSLGHARDALPIPIGSVASSTSVWRTSKPCTRSGARAAPTS